MKIDDLTGRELDMAVAKHVLDYEVEERINTTTGEKDAVSRQPEPAWLAPRLTPHRTRGMRSVLPGVRHGGRHPSPQTDPRAQEPSLGKYRRRTGGEGRRRS